MVVQKIFSEVGGDMKLYSVLVSEEELSLFSELQKEFGNAQNKLAKKAWELGQVRRSGALMGYPEKVNEGLRNFRRVNSKESRQIARTGLISKGKSREELKKNLTRNGNLVSSIGERGETKKILRDAFTDKGLSVGSDKWSQFR